MNDTQAKETSAMDRRTAIGLAAGGLAVTTAQQGIGAPAAPREAPACPGPSRRGGATAHGHARQH